jgi:hypothetical protein
MKERLTEWVDARTAAIFLKPCTPEVLNRHLGPMLRRESANRPGARTARSGGWLYHRDDLERVRAIMEVMGCSPLKATQHFHMIRRCQDRKLLEWLLERELMRSVRDDRQLDIDDKLKRRRKFQ